MSGINVVGAPKAGPWKGHLKQVFRIDIEICTECDGALKVAGPVNPCS